MKALKLFSFAALFFAASYSVSAQQQTNPVVRQAVQPVNVSTDQTPEVITKVPAATVPVVLGNSNDQSDLLKAAPHMPSTSDVDYPAKKDAWVKNYPQEYEKVVEINTKKALAEPLSQPE